MFLSKIDINHRSSGVPCQFWGLFGREAPSLNANMTYDAQNKLPK
jgi:hypothetical protein